MNYYLDACCRWRRRKFRGDQSRRPLLSRERTAAAGASIKVFLDLNHSFTLTSIFIYFAPKKKTNNQSGKIFMASRRASLRGIVR